MLSWDDGDPNVPDEIGQTPVHLAAKCGKASSLQLLLSKGGRLDLKDDDGLTAIKLATDQSIDAIIQHQIATMIGKQISKFFTRRMEGLQSFCSFTLDEKQYTGCELFLNDVSE